MRAALGKVCWSCSSGSALDSKGVRLLMLLVPSDRLHPLFPESFAKGSSSKSVCLAHTTTLTPLTYTAPQHLHTHRPTITSLTYTAPQHLHTSPYTYTTHLHCATAFAHIAPHTLHTPYTPLHLHRSPTPRHSICTHRLHIAFNFIFF